MGKLLTHVDLVKLRNGHKTMCTSMHLHVFVPATLVKWLHLNLCGMVVWALHLQLEIVRQFPAALFM